MSRVMGRLGLLSEVQDLLEQGQSVALHGPTGIGKSALLDALEQRRREQPDALVLRANGAPAEHGLAYAALQDLADQLPVELGGTLPALAAAVDDHRLRTVLCTSFRSLLEEASRSRPVLILLDDVQWLDPQSACVIGFGRRRLADRVGLVATVGPARDPMSEGDVDLSDLHHLEVPPLDAAAMIELLGAHGVPAPVAQRLHVESGGLPSLALALGGAAREQPVLLGRPTPLPASLERVLRDRFLAQQEGVRTTVALAALLHRPTVRQLERAGRVEADQHLRAAAAAGLVTRSGDTLRFTPSELGRVVTEAVPAVRRTERWPRSRPRRPSGSGTARSPTPVPTPRQPASSPWSPASPPAPVTARSPPSSTSWPPTGRRPSSAPNASSGWRPRSRPGRRATMWSSCTAHSTTSWSCRPTRRRPSGCGSRCRELAGSGVAALDEVLAAALTDAGEDDRLVAMVLLQRSRVALMESRPDEAGRLAERAAGLFHRAGDRVAEASACTTLAVSARWTGTGLHDTHLAEALALVPASEPAQPGLTHTSPAYIAARFALYDDRLEEAWAANLSMLAQVERGAGMDQVHVLRCLVEVGVRLGRCREAMAYAARATQVGEEFGLDPHTGWFISALAELAGGDLESARILAEQGSVAAEERGDTRYLQRHLLLLGQAQLRGGDAESARATLARIQEIEDSHGITDPTVNRWQPELVSALVALGAVDEAGAVLARARQAIDGRSGTDGVGAQLDRAEAEVLCAAGDLDGAAHLLDRAAKVCADIGMRVELGRTLLTRAHVERRARRAAAARTTLESAAAVFEALHAQPWLAQVRAELAPCPVDGTGDPMLGRLTDTEARIAQLVCQGASNRQIAERQHLSVKTVEAALTRIYRKLDVRSRTQLATLLVPVPTE